MSSDKKKRGGKLTFALPTAIGAVEYNHTVGEALLSQVITTATD
jgi:3-dehydroquinate synthetase